MRIYPVKENPIGSAVSKILLNRHTDILLLQYKDNAVKKNQSNQKVKKLKIPEKVDKCREWVKVGQVKGSHVEYTPLEQGYLETNLTNV